MVPSFEEVVFKLKKGETTLVPVETPYGYHIIRVDDKGMRDATDPTTNKKTKTEQVKARHILIAFPNFDKIFSEFADKADVKVGGKVHDPFIKIRNQTSSSTKQ
jgi:parvulin-like peptidyl-prolyl isomerase